MDRSASGQQPLRSTTSTIDIYIKLAHYPILADKIRARMRDEIFSRGIVTEEKFEQEVEALAVESQRREGLYDPYNEEPEPVWLTRKARIRALHTDFYFGYNLPSQLFESLIEETLEEIPETRQPSDLAFNPEIAPWTMLFKQGEIYEDLAPPEREKVAHHLEEIKVVLIKGMISDQLPFIAVAKKVFTIADLRKIYQRRIGSGKIGGKAAGMLLAWRILQRRDPQFGPDLSQHVEIPDSYFLGTDVIYDFRRTNNLDHLMNQKYRSLDEIRDEYPRVIASHLRGEFPVTIVEQLREVLRQMGDSPLIVRSSSLLEDNFGTSFAGKYHSFFCPNQATEDENLEDLLDAIRRVFASTLNPDAILYRRQHRLIDYDERMAVLIQRVQGHRYGRYFFPAVAGVGFSHNPFRWNAKIRREDGFLRIVWGLGTRAVERGGEDYPRLVALSHPQLRPESTAEEVRRYAQRFVDVIDLEENVLTSIPVIRLLDLDYPLLRFVASVQKDDYIQDFFSGGLGDEAGDLVITFNNLLQDRRFTRLLSTALLRLEEGYATPVDIEFTVEITPGYPQVTYTLHLLQCRPLSQREEGAPVEIPQDLPGDVLFSASGLIPDGRIEGVRYIVFVDPHRYHAIPDVTVRLEIGRAVGRLNEALRGERFVLMGPGRWGSNNLDLGVRVGYADIFNTRALIEIGVPGNDGNPELSYGTHFFQDLVEGGIFALPLELGQEGSRLEWTFFEEAPNALASLLPDDSELEPFLKVIDLSTVAPNRSLTILMDGSSERAVGFLADGIWSPDEETGDLSSP